MAFSIVAGFITEDILVLFFINNAIMGGTKEKEAK